MQYDGATLDEYLVEEGKSDTLVIGGTTFAPGDISAVAASLDRPMFAPANPFYSQREWISDPQEYNRELVGEYLDYAARNYFDTIIAHSRGNLSALDLIGEMRSEGMAPPKKLILIAPPLNPNGLADASSKKVPYTMVPSICDVLKQVTHDMPLDTLDDMVRRHTKEYGNLFTQVLLTMIAEVRSNIFQKIPNLIRNLKEIKTLIISGTNDPWHHEENLAKAIAGKPTITSVNMPTGHFPHVHAPERVAEEILAWEK